MNETATLTGVGGGGRGIAKAKIDIRLGHFVGLSPLPVSVLINPTVFVTNPYVFLICAT